MVKLDIEKFPGMKVLMVDDTPAKLNILGHILKLSGLDVSVALEMKKAPDTARMSKPYLIMSSVNMPGVDGYEICEKLKKD